MAKKMTVCEDAKIVKRQHKKPCIDCPWAKDAVKGWLGTGSAEWWLSLAHYDGTSECHAMRKAGSPLECAGLAIYRANVCKMPPDGAMSLPADRESVFAMPTEFYEHHTGKKMTLPILPTVAE